MALSGTLFWNVYTAPCNYSPYFLIFDSLPHYVCKNVRSFGTVKGLEFSRNFHDLQISVKSGIRLDARKGSIKATYNKRNSNKTHEILIFIISVPVSYSLLTISRISSRFIASKISRKFSTLADFLVSHHNSISSAGFLTSEINFIC